MVVNGAGHVVLLLVEENALKSVYVQFVWVSVLGIENGVTKRKKSRRFVEVGTKNGVTIARIIICHKFHLDGIVTQSKQLIYVTAGFFLKGNVGSIGVYGADKSRFGQAGQFDNFAVGLVLVEDKVDGKIFSLLVDRRSSFAKSVLGTCNFFTGLGAFDNQVTLILGKSKKYMGDEFAGGRIVKEYKPHIKNVDSNAASEQVVN